MGITYNSWDLEKPCIPKHSNLYQLKSLGIGTHYVESLTGYIPRLSESHNVLPRVLIVREIASLAKTECIRNITSRGLGTFFECAKAVNSTGNMAKGLVQALQLLETTENLQRSLCLALHSVNIRKEPRKESGLGIVTDRNYP